MKQVGVMIVVMLMVSVLYVIGRVVLLVMNFIVMSVSLTWRGEIR
jgi:hypothetical protein